VKDTGIGIAPEDFGRIFEDFTQVENPLQRKVKGTGLGLPLSKKLAGLLGGEILVESKPLEGSTFILQIPAKLQSIIETSSPSPTAEESAGSPVLVVENRSETVLLYRKWLRDTPFRIVHVSSTREAERAIAIERPAAIILDILLDGEDSWGLLASLKNHDETRGIPIIVCSTTDDRRKALHLGADAYLVKPTSAENLLDALPAVLGQ
jgi:CheY-like chemotaxis protein